MEDRVRRGEHAAHQRPRSASARRGERAQADPRRNRELEAGCGLQSAGTVSRGSRLRSERRELPRVTADALHRLQSAWTRARARQGFVEEASDLSPHSVTGFCRVPAAAKNPPPAAPRLPAHRQEPERGCLLGISQASVVDSDEKLAERVSFIHESIGTPAIAEQYIEGRELYVGVLGNERLRVFPIWELEFGS